jgi:2-amino-4-hydroxy-6-hydroxymethyldihydropteridine diphosphokinase
MVARSPEHKSAPRTLHLVALGANLPSSLGNPRETLHHAMARLQQEGLRIAARSAWYRTPAYPAGAGPDFVNAAIALEASGTPDELLRILHETERAAGRERPERWAPRTCDLDLLASGACVRPSQALWHHWANLPPERQAVEAPGELVLPHPRLHERGFVLRPLADIAPRWRHPVLGRTVAELLADLPPGSLQGIRRIE